MVLRSQRGQTMVEYILLLAVAVSLVLTFYRSESFKRLFGEQGILGEQIKSQSEYSFRHASSKPEGGADVPKFNKEGSIHPSYADPIDGGTRFFGPREIYP